MSFPIEKKLVIAISSSALFDLSEANEVFEKEGAAAYKRFQEENIDRVLPKGVAFPFIKRFLSINERLKEYQPVEVILLSRNSAATGKRVFRSINDYGLNITRAAFMEGKSPFQYVPAFNASLFLSTNSEDVSLAVKSGFPAGLVLDSKIIEDDEQNELRVAFDFDGVVADDEAETVYKTGSLASFIQHESDKVHIPHTPGPLADLFKKLSNLQKLENEQSAKDSDYQRALRISIVTARSAPAHERVITTLEDWGVSPNEVFFLGGMEKSRILGTLKPHLFFDDQLAHLDINSSNTPLVHIPFGIANKG